MSCALYLRFMRGLRPLYEEMYALTRDDVALVMRRLALGAAATRDRAVPLDAHRKRLFPAGLVLLEALMRRFGVDSFRVTARDLRWGAAIMGGAGRAEGSAR